MSCQSNSVMRSSLKLRSADPILYLYPQCWDQEALGERAVPRQKFGANSKETWSEKEHSPTPLTFLTPTPLCGQCPRCTTDPCREAAGAGGRATRRRPRSQHRPLEMWLKLGTWARLFAHSQWKEFWNEFWIDSIFFVRLVNNTEQS